MSLFKDNEKLITAIKFFNKLSSARQAFFVTNFSKPDSQFKEDELQSLVPLVNAIRNDMSHYSPSQLANRLVELGIEKTYAVLFTSNIIKEAPTMEYEVKLLSEIPDEEFKTKLPGIVKAIWVDRESKEEKILSEFGVTLEQLNAASDVFRTAMNETLRADTSDEIIKYNLKENGFSEYKIDTFMNTIKINTEFWRKFLIFSNTQDAYFTSNKIEQQNREMLSLLRELLKIFTEKDKQPGHFQ